MREFDFGTMACTLGATAPQLAWVHAALSQTGKVFAATMSAGGEHLAIAGALTSGVQDIAHPEANGIPCWHCSADASEPANRRRIKTPVTN